MLCLTIPGAGQGAQKVFDVLDYGAVGNGRVLDTTAIQRAIDAAGVAGGGARVRVHGGHQYLVGTLELRSGIEFHLEAGAELLISTNQQDYRGDGVITATGAVGLKLTGTGKISGRAREFMTGYDGKGEWWIPAEWRPKMFLLTACTNLEIRDLTFAEAPHWGLHMLGCRNVRIERVTIRNLLDVPNCDGIDPDHCQNVEIRNCDIVCGDDAIVIKATRQEKDYGPCAHIRVHDCVLETQDSGLKIGTETTQDIHDIRFERCHIRTGSRGLTIQLRDEGNVYDVRFEDINFVSRYYADPWWGRGEGISVTAIPRTPATKVGTIHDVRFKNIRGRAENSARICGTAASPIRHVRLENVALSLDRWTRYPGGLFDNRPTQVLLPIEAHGTPGLYLRYADDVLLKDCRVSWGTQVPEYFTCALEAERVTALKMKNFKGAAAHPQRDKAVSVSDSEPASPCFPVHIKVDAGRPGTAWQPIWRFFGADEPNYAYMKDGRKLLGELGSLAPKQVYFRAHNLLTSGDGTPALKWGSTGAYREDAQGHAVYDWTILDRIFDTYLQNGVRPYVEIGFMPKALSLRPEPYQHQWQPGAKYEKVYTGWAFPPRDYGKWGDLACEWTRHCLSRYGASELEHWYWEVWNEPNIGYWRGTPQEFLKLHDYAVAGVRRAFPTARVGGPDMAGGGGKFLRDFIEHCLRGTNYATGQIGTPLNFVAFHAKGSPQFTNGHVQMGMASQLRAIDAGFSTIASFPELRSTPVIIGESDPDGCAACQGPQLGYRNGTLYSSYTAASFARKLELAQKHAVNLEGALSWAFEFEGQPYFAGFRVLASNGLDLPVLNVFRMFSQMGWQRVPATSDAAVPLEAILQRGVRAEPDVSALATLDANKLCVMVWHYHDEDVSGPDAEVRLEMGGLPIGNGAARLTHLRIDAEHSNAFAEWQRLGSPPQPSEAQYAKLEQAGHLTALSAPETVPIANHRATARFALPRQAVSLLVLEWTDGASVPAGQSGSDSERVAPKPLYRDPIHAPAPRAKPTLFLIGDSTVRNRTRGQLGWGETIGSWFDPARIIVTNRALGGRSSRSFLTEGLWNQVLDPLKPGDFVLMQFGHNDGGPLDDGKARASLKGSGDDSQVVTNKVSSKVETVHTYGWYLRKYISDAKAKGATPIVLSLVPRKIWKDGKVARSSNDYAKWAAEAAKTEGVAFVDLNDIVARHYEALGQDKVNALFADDHTHTNPEGAELNARCVVEGLRALKDCQLTEYLRPEGKP